MKCETEGVATKSQIKAAKQVKKQLETLLAEVAPTEIFVKQALQEAIGKQLNKHTENWQPINKSIEWKGNTYTSAMMPAAQLPALKQSYQNSNVQGISSMSTSESNHAVNLWVSEFKDSTGESIFKGVRHGVNTPFGLSDSDLRKAGAIKRTDEVITAALDIKKEQIKAHLSSDQKDKPFLLKLTSSSLLTPSQYFGSKAYNERQFVKEQIQAWQQAGTEIKTFPVEINGEIKNVNVKLQVLAFNYGVNGGAKLASIKPFKGVKYFEHFKLDKVISFADQLDQSDISGWKMSDKINQKPITQLLNWAINYKEGCHDDIKKQRIQTYMDNIAELQSKGKYRLDGNRAYALPEQVVLLSNEIDVVPAWNCKSGKDRTGLLDAEVKQSLIEQLERNGKTADFSHAMKGRRQQLHDKVLLESGNHEIQQANTGVVGYKVLGNGTLTVESNANNISPQHHAKVRGLSDAVGS